MTRKVSLALVLAFPLLLAACGSPAEQLVSNDTEVNHPLSVFKDPRIAVIPSDGRGHVDADPTEITHFVVDYVRRGNGPIEIAGSSADITATARLLVSAGAKPGELQPRVRSGGGVTVTFDAYQVSLPECGDYASDKELFHNATNKISTNLGCATQRNLGLMVSNPHDLIARRSPGEPVNSSLGVGAVEDARTFVKPDILKFEASGSK